MCSVCTYNELYSLSRKIRQNHSFVLDLDNLIVLCTKLVCMFNPLSAATRLLRSISLAMTYIRIIYSSVRVYVCACVCKSATLVLSVSTCSLDVPAWHPNEAGVMH